MKSIEKDLSDYIIYEDQHLIVLNKPEGVLVIPDGFDMSQQNLRDILTAKFGKIWVTHRLDRDASGVLVFAKDPDTHKRINTCFSKRRTIKKYLAIFHGVPFWEEKTIDYPLQVNGDRLHRTVVNIAEGKPASTSVRILDKGNFSCRALIMPRTGYTHQIRSHLANLGHPIIGDVLYDRQRLRDTDNKIQFLSTENGLYLHAASLQISDDTLDLPVFLAPPPEKYGVFERIFAM